MIQVEGHPDYEVGYLGTVRNIKTRRILKPRVNNTGYARVCLNGKEKLVHRLVAEAYIPNPEGRAQVNHKDYDRLNNTVSNLEWATASENCRHARVPERAVRRCKWG